ncbi:MAG: hypothetical protein ACE5LU_19670 [Anaerolineae bacterium]
MTAPQMSPRVVAVARIMKRFSRDELQQLLTLVPGLREVQPSDEEALVTYFRQLGLEQRGGRPPSPDDPFIGGLTYAEYFTLSEAEQDAVWDQLFAEVTLDMESMPEVDVAPHADVSAG